MVVLFCRGGYNKINMKKLKPNQDGFIPMMLTLLAILLTVIVLVYLRVLKAHK